MQVDPIDPTFKGPGIWRLKLEYDIPLSNVAFIFNLRRYMMGLAGMFAAQKTLAGGGGARAQLATSQGAMTC